MRQNLNLHFFQSSSHALPAIELIFIAIVLAIAVWASAEIEKNHGLDLTAMNRTIGPGNDFFAYANGSWVHATEIPADRARLSSFNILAEVVDRRTADLLQEKTKPGVAAGSDEQKAHDYFAAYMNEQLIETKAVQPVKQELEAIAVIRDKSTLARFLGSQMRADVDPMNNTNFYTDRLFGLWVSPDFDHPDLYTGYLLQGGLGMPDRDYYQGKDKDNVELQAKYRGHISAVLTLAGVTEPAAKAERIYDLESKIAATHVSRTDSLEVHKANNRWLMQDFETKAPGLEWTRYFAAAALAKQNNLIVWHPSAVTGIAALIASEPLDTWKDYLTFHAIDRASPLLSHAFVNEHFEFYDKALLGSKEIRDRWKRAVEAANQDLGDAVGKIYVDRYFPPSAKKEAQDMVANIVVAFDHRIDQLEWMSPETRAKAKTKLKTLYVGIGYPEKWRNYSGLQISLEDSYGNSQRAQLFRYVREVARLGQKVDKTEWSMTPQTVNAVNLPLQNALNFPAAILDRPFFDPNTDAAQNYGGIGSVIGHEISHSFDDQGSQFTAEGQLANWWTPQDFAHFREAADRLVAQYNQYEPLPGSHINGQLTLSENIADVAGISAAYDGYRAVYQGKEGPAAQGFSGDQRFFLSFGQIWRSKSRPEALRNSLITNSHSPGEFRADTVRNIDSWYLAFKVQPDQRLFLNPDARIRVW